MLAGLALLLAALLIGPDARAQILSNGNFETGDLTGWTTAAGSGTVTFSVPTGTAGLSNPVHAGSYAFEADVTNAGSNTYPTLTHTAFTANANSVYYLRFFAWSGSPNPVNRPNMRLHIASTAGSYNILFTPSNAGYDEYHFAFKASGSTTVSFTFEQAATFNLDDIEVHDQTDTSYDPTVSYLWQWGFQGLGTQSNCFIGGDNDISTPLPDGRVAWFFNDSFVQTITYTTDVRGGWSFPRNYVAVQSVPASTPATSTLVPLATDNTAVFKPTGNEPNPNGYTVSNPIYWPNDAIVDGNNVVVLLDEPNDGGDGDLIGKASATLALPALTLTGYDYRTFGNFVLNAGDGYFYIYDGDGNGGMFVARAAQGSLNSFATWTYWNGTGWVADKTQAATVPGLGGGVRTFERLGPNNYVAIAGGGPLASISAQFASSPWGTWSSAKTVANTFAQKGASYYYMACLHRETYQNGVYTVGFCDAYNNENDGTSIYGSLHPQKSKGIYNPHYTKSSNLLTLSPYTTTTFSESFTNGYEAIGWRNCGGTWTVADGTLQQSDATASFCSVVKGIVESNLNFTADVACTPASGGGAGLFFRASNYANGTDNHLGYNVLLKPGTGVVLSASTGNGGNVTLGTYPAALTAGTTYQVKVIAYGTLIQVYVTDLTTPVISVVDATYASGGIGVRSDKATATFDSLSVFAPTAAQATLTSFTPASGVVGSSVTIKGTNFVSPLSVAFAGTPATVSNLTSKQLTVTVPNGASSGLVTVTTSSGSISTKTNYTVGAVPVVTSTTTASGIVGQPFTYTISASNSPTSYAATGLPAGLSLNATSGLISGQPTATGNSTVTLKATNAYGTGTMTLTVNVQAQPTFTSWQSTNFTAAQQADASISGPTATPAGDGITNLMKYALGLSPFVVGTNGLPIPSTVAVNGASYLALTYTGLIGATDVGYTVQVSSDLKDWFSGQSYTTTVSTTHNADGKTQTMVVRDLTSTQASGGKRFIRLNVSLP